jgi:TIR domain
MGHSVLVFISHSSEDKESFIEPIVSDLEDCYINVWFDKRKILPGDNLRKSIFRDGLDKADVALIFFTQQSLKSSWVDREIKHVLREEGKKGNDFDLSKIISIFDCTETYEEISERYPELTDDLLHLMPENYDKVHLGQLVSAIWSKYLSLQGGDVETQRQLLAKEKQIFQNEKSIQDLKDKLKDIKSKNSNSPLLEEFESFSQSGKIDEFVKHSDRILTEQYTKASSLQNVPQAVAFGLVTIDGDKDLQLTDKGKKFFQWYMLNENKP